MKQSRPYLHDQVSPLYCHRHPKLTSENRCCITEILEGFESKF